MTSMFDSDVSRRRNHTPWAAIGLKSFMHEMMWNGASTKDGEPSVPVTLSVVYRPDVASRQWWTISWKSESGETLAVSAQDLNLALWRAAEMEMRRRKPRTQPPSEDEAPPPARVIGPEGT